MFLCLFLFSVKAIADTYYLPHIHSGSDAWETYLIIENPVYSGTIYKLTLFDDNGNVVTSQTGSIPFGETMIIPLRTLGGTSGIFETNGQTVRVRLGYIAKDDLGGGTAEFPLSSTLTSQAIFSLSNYYNQLTWSGFALFNGSERTISVTARGYRSGSLIVSKTFTMNPKTKVVDFFDSFLGLANFTDVDTVVFISDFPGLTGIVISGKDNDKLLFSPFQHTVKEQFLNITRQYEGFIHQTNFVFNGEDYFTIIYHDGKIYLKRIMGNTIDGFEEKELSGDLWPITLVNASNSSDLIILGTNNSNNFIARKIDTSGNTIWETTLGIAPTTWLFDPDLLNIVGAAISGTIITAFYDYQLSKGFVKAINESDGSIISSSEWTSTGRFYKAFVAGSNVGIAWCYSFGSTNYIQFMFYNSSGTLLKQLYGESPVAPNTHNVIFDAFEYNNNIYCCFGTKISDGSTANYSYYSTYLMVLPYSSTDLSSLYMLYNLNLFLQQGSKIFSTITPAFISGYDFTWALLTSPYLNALYSSTFLVNIKENTTKNGVTFSSYTFRRDLPYRVMSACGEFLGFVLTTMESQTVGDSLVDIYKVTDKELFGYNLYNY